jgi:hypothetical protein
VHANAQLSALKSVVRFDCYEQLQNFAGGFDGLADSQFRAGPNLDADQRAQFILVCRSLFGGWNQTAGGGFWKKSQPDLHLNEFGRFLDDEWRAQ